MHVNLAESYFIFSLVSEITPTQPLVFLTGVDFSLNTSSNSPIAGYSNRGNATLIYLYTYSITMNAVSCILSLFMSPLLCMCAPVGVYNYSDTQGDSPKSRER